MPDYNIIKEMGFKFFTLSSPNVMTGASALLLKQDILRSCPVFILRPSVILEKEYLFNLAGYMSASGYSFYWEGDQVPDEQKSRTVLLAESDERTPAPDVQIYPGLEGKKALWHQIGHYVSAVAALNVPLLPNKDAQIILMKPNKSITWLYNMAGFFSKWKIPFSWDCADTAEKGVFIGKEQDKHSSFIKIPQDVDEKEQKKQVLNKLFDLNLIIKHSDGTYSDGKNNA